jgi:hypothetical protein
MIAIANEAQVDAYSEKFDNFDEVGHPAIVTTARFGDLLQKATNRGSPLTRQEVEAVFGDLSWEE